MSLIGLIVVVLILGVVLYLFKDKIEPRLLTLIVVLITVGVVCWILRATGVWSGGPELK